MDNQKYWIAFSKIGFPNGRFQLKLWEHFKSIKEAWLASYSDLISVKGINLEHVQKFVDERQKVNPDVLLNYLYDKNIKFLTIEDETYPESLKAIKDTPPILFYKGNLAQCNLNKSLAIVGSRKSSFGIKDILNKIICNLAGQDITIVSGLALGIDAYAHQAALDYDLKTIAVVGAGVEYIYPKENKELYKKICDKGVVLSEYWPEERADTWKFPQRNRIISALSQGTLVAEAGLKSGALITAKTCLDQKKELMCIPGSVANPNTQGVNKLIKDGAKIVDCAQDIFKYLKWNKTCTITTNNKENNEVENNLLDNEKKIYEILNLETKSFDEILAESKLNVDELMVILTTMELNGIIKEVPGQKYMKQCL